MIYCDVIYCDVIRARLFEYFITAIENNYNKYINLNDVSEFSKHFYCQIVKFDTSFHTNVVHII